MSSDTQNNNVVVVNFYNPRPPLTQTLNEDRLKGFSREQLISVIEGLASVAMRHILLSRRMEQNGDVGHADG